MSILDKLLQNVELGRLIFVERRPVRDYVNDKPSDKVVGFRYMIIVPDLGYAQISVKIMGTARLVEPAQPTEVICTGLRAVPYVNRQGRVDVAFKADEIREAKG